jgi:hypothetical protein
LYIIQEATSQYFKVGVSKNDMLLWRQGYTIYSRGTGESSPLNRRVKYQTWILPNKMLMTL